MMSGPYRDATRPYHYDREDMHQALLSHCKSGYDGLNYVFFPVHASHMKLEEVVEHYNRAGFHVHAFACNRSGYDLYVERMYINNRWGDREVNYDYAQADMPPFEEDVK